MKIYMPCKRVTSFLLEDVYNVSLRLPTKAKHAQKQEEGGGGEERK